MEELLKVTANHVALAVETVAVLIVAIGALNALIEIAATLLRGRRQPHWGRSIWITFGGWLLGALQFALAADIVRSAIARTWEQIGQLAAIRTFLSFFLEKDLAEMARARRESATAA